MQTAHNLLNLSVNYALRRLARRMACQLPRYAAVVATIFLVSLLVACGGGSGSDSSADGARVSATIGAQGGTLVGPDGVSVVIPAGALDQPTVISVARTSVGAPDVLEAYPVAGNVYEFTPHNVNFNGLVTINAPVPNGATGAELFMASPGGSWKQLETQVANGVATWERNTFSYAYVPYPCGVPVAMFNDPYWCARERSFARIVATPPQALTLTSVPNIMTGDAGSYLLTQAASLQVTSTFGVPGNCRNVSVTLKHSLYDSVAHTWSPLQPFKAPLSPALSSSANGHLLEGSAPFTVASNELANGKHRLSLIVDFECPKVAHAPNSSTVTGWDTANYEARRIGDGMVVEVGITPPAVSYTVGGTVSGLTGSGLVLQNNGTNSTPVAADGSFAFSNTVGAGTPYNVSVLAQPSGQLCTVQYGSGTANSDINNVAVSCVAAHTIGGTVSGYAGSGLVLQNNNGDDLALATNGPFTFATPIVDGSSYSVSILTQPTASTCTVQQGSGTANAPVIDVAVNCTSSGPIAVVANSGGNTLSIFRTNAGTGVPAVLGNIAAGSYPYAVAISPTGLYAYVTNLVGGSISSYSIDIITGAVAAIPSSTPATLNPYGIAMDPQGRFLWVANYGYSTVSAFVIGANGALTASGSPLTTGAFPRVVTADPSGTFVYVASEGGNDISVYHINGNGTLTLVPGTLSNSVSSPNSIAFHPSGQFVYVADSNSVAAFTVNTTTGVLSSPAYYAAPSSPTAVAVHPNGNFLYVVGSGSQDIWVYWIRPGTGVLEALGTGTVSTGSSPQGLVIDRTGSYLYVTSGGDSSVSTFSIDATTGALTEVGTAQATGSSPVGIAITP